MEDATRFSRVRFFLKRSGRDTEIQWSASDSVLVKVEMRADGNVYKFEQVWKGQPANLAQVNKSLSSAWEATSPGGSAYRLDINRDGSQTKMLSWSDENESEGLRDLRLLLEGLSHRRFSESLACLKWGRELMAAGKTDEAVKTLREGIELLGDDYVDEPIPDDTGVRLILAEEHREKGELRQSFVFFDRVLESRVQVYFESFLKKRGIACDPQGDAHPLLKT